MILLNFAHSLNTAQLQQVESLVGQKVERVIEVHSQIDPQLSLIPQIAILVDQIDFSSTEWQSLPLLVNPPALNFSAVALLAELHGRCGYFPAHLRMRPVHGSIPTRYEVAEVLDLQALRDGARRKRS